MIEAIRSITASIQSQIEPWDESSAHALSHKNTNLLDLKEQILANIETINERVDESALGTFLYDLHTSLNTINTHLPSIANASYFNVCVDANYEVTKLLTQFGYSNNRVDRIIQSSLSSRKEAQKAYQDIINAAEKTTQLKAELDEKKTKIEEFFTQCFDEDNEESFDNKSKCIDGAYEKICTESGYLENIEEASKEADTFRDEILEYRNELLEGDSEEESVKTQINDLVQDLLAQQKKMEKFIQEYITGTSTVSEGEDGNETSTTIKSKKQLIDDLHDSFQKYIDQEDFKIAGYKSAFELYESKKKEEIEGLLKSATNASLASSFEIFRKTTEKLKKKSETLFIWALIAVVAAILLPYIPVFNEWMFNTDNLYLNLLKRVLLTGPFIWWAFHQSRKANQYFRLEQEYAHKEVVSRSFEGYKSQVLDLYKESEASNLMLQHLLVGSINTITKNPAEVLDNVSHTCSPAEEVGETISKAAKATYKMVKPSGEK